MAAAGAGVAALAPQSLAAGTTPGEGVPSPAPARKFYTVLSLGRLGLHGTFEESVALAAKHGFEAIDPDEELFARLPEGDLEKLLDGLKARNLKLGAAELPVDFRGSEANFNNGLAKLPGAAQALERAGVRRVSTWIMPCSNELTYLQNFRQHASRLRACALVLQDHGQQLGLEYCTPRTLWRSQRHSFIHIIE
jgi:hypothetical protein